MVKPELIHGLSYAEYAKLSGVTQTELARFYESPANVPYFRANPIKATEAMQFGTICHSALWSPDEYTVGVSHVRQPLTYPAGKSDSANGVTKGDEVPWSPTATFCKAWTAEQTLPILRAGQAEDVDNICENVTRMVPEASIDNKGFSEVVIFGVDEITGLPIKSRLDRLTQDASEQPLILDLKVTGQLSRFKYTVEERYFLQAAHYTEMLKLTDVGHAPFAFVAVDTSAPHAVEFVQLSPEYMEYAVAMRRRLLDLWWLCETMNVWPACPSSQLEYAKDASGKPIPITLGIKPASSREPLPLPYSFRNKTN